MLRISTFGRLALDDETGPVGGVGSWRPTLAALALLAASGDQGVPRERLLSMLWPESAPERARNSLKQLLSALRRTVPEAAIPGTTLLRLDRGTVSCDLWDFRNALARGDLDAAVSAYAGPFLDGFSLPGAVEFERWAEGERVRLAGEFHDAVETLAERASAAGDHRAAVSYLRRLAVAEPLDSDVALRLMLALVASGNRAGALQHFDIHAALVQQELECAPDPAIVEYASVLREIPRVAAVAGVSQRSAATETRTSRVPSHSVRPAEERTGATTLRLVSNDEAAPADAATASLSVTADPTPSASESDTSSPVGDPDIGTNHHPAALEATPRSSPRRRHRSLVAGSVAAGVVLGFSLFGLFSRVGRPQDRVVAESASGSVVAPSLVAVVPFSVQ